MWGNGAERGFDRLSEKGLLHRLSTPYGFMKVNVCVGYRGST